MQIGSIISYYESRYNVIIVKGERKKETIESYLNEITQDPAQVINLDGVVKPLHKLRDGFEVFCPAHNKIMQNRCAALHVNVLKNCFI